jgi:hypothetical protein
MPLPIRLAAAFDAELAFVPLEDIDPFYHNQLVSSITKGFRDIAFDSFLDEQKCWDTNTQMFEDVISLIHRPSSLSRGKRISFDFRPRMQCGF